MIYDIFTESDRMDLRDAVNRALEDGWQLVGGVSIAFRPVSENGYDESYIIYSQALSHTDHSFARII